MRILFVIFFSMSRFCLASTGIVFAGVVFAGVAFAESDTQTLPDLYLGQQGLQQEVIVNDIAKGVKHYQILRGKQGKDSFFVLSASVASEQKALTYQKKLSILGYQADIEYPAELGPDGKRLNVRIIVGQYQNKNQATDVKKHLANKIDLPFSVRYRPEDGHSTSGPFQVSLLAIDLKQYTGKIISALAQGKIKGKASTSAIAAKHNALAAVNAGFFVWEPKVGTPGDLAGISVVDGKLVSEAVAGRPALVIKNKGRSLAIHHNIKSDIQLTIAGTTYQLQGLNRVAGKTLNCGNKFDTKLTQAAHDFVCHNDAEAILYTPEFGANVSLSNGLALVIANNKVEQRIKLSDQQAQTITIPNAGSVVYFSQGYLHHIDTKAATFTLQQNAIINVQLTSDEGDISLDSNLYLINGGPTLVQNGNIVIANRITEGWATHYAQGQVNDKYLDKKDAISSSARVGDRTAYYYSWVVRRHPRTAIGITANNIVYIAVVYGRQPGISAGASVTEMARLMKQLGAVEALNLDGGGSSMMTVNSVNTGLSSDNTGERTIGDALLLIH